MLLFGRSLEHEEARGEDLVIIFRAAVSLYFANIQPQKREQMKCSRTRSAAFFLKQIWEAETQGLDVELKECLSHVLKTTGADARGLEVVFFTWDFGDTLEETLSCVVTAKALYREQMAKEGEEEDTRMEKARAILTALEGSVNVRFMDCLFPHPPWQPSLREVYRQ